MSQITFAASEEALRTLFVAFRDSFHWSKADSGDFGPFSAGYDIQLHLDGGTFDLQSDGTISIHELDIRYDRFDVWLGIDLPEFCVGGWCILPTPWGCAIRLPRFCVFEDDPDITIPLDLSAIVSEVSGGFRLHPRYFIDPARPPGESDLRAELNGRPNQWRVFLDPVWLDVDPIDVPDTIGNILKDISEALIDTLLGWLPGWARDAIKWLIGSVIDLIRRILNIPDQIDEWLSDLLNFSFGLFDFILTAIADHFAKKTPIMALNDPYTVLPWDGSLIPIRMPLRELAINVDTHEAVVSTKVGGVA